MILVLLHEFFLFLPENLMFPKWKIFAAMQHSCHRYRMHMKLEMTIQEKILKNCKKLQQYSAIHEKQLFEGGGVEH